MVSALNLDGLPTLDRGVAFIGLVIIVVAAVILFWPSGGRHARNGGEGNGGAVFLTVAVAVTLATVIGLYIALRGGR